MDIGFLDIYGETLNYICAAIHDISLSINSKSKSVSSYRLIPYAKKGKKHIIVNALELSSSESYTIFLSNQTIGIKVFDSQLNKLYEYAVSKNNDTKIIQLNYQNGTGIKQIYQINPKNNEFELVNIAIYEYLKNVIDISPYQSSIVNDNLLMHMQFNKKVGETMLRRRVAFRDGLAKAENQSYYSFDLHPELFKISTSMKLEKEELIETYLTISEAIEPDAFLKEIELFYSNYKKMIKDLSKSDKKTDQTNPEDYNNR